MSTQQQEQTDLEILNTKLKELKDQKNQIDEKINELNSKKDKCRIQHLITKQVLKNVKFVLFVHQYKSDNEISYSLLFNEINRDLSNELHDIFEASYHSNIEFDLGALLEFSDGQITIYIDDEENLKYLIQKYELNVEFDKKALATDIKNKINIYKKVCDVLEGKVDEAFFQMLKLEING